MSKTAEENTTATVNSSKRKLDNENETSIPKKKKYRSKSDIKAKIDEQPQRNTATKDRPTDHDQSVAMKDPSLLADFFGQKIAKHNKDSTSIEQEDMGIPSPWIRDTTDFTYARTATNLPAYLEKFLPGGKNKLTTCKAMASPHTLIITSSGIRVADLCRELRVYNTKDSKVGKFIAKHMKLKENVEYLSKTNVGIAVSTPARFKDLLEQNAMKADELRSVVLDVSYLDEKKRSIVDMDDLFRSLLQLLKHEKIQERFQGTKGRDVRVLVF